MYFLYKIEPKMLHLQKFLLLQLGPYFMYRSLIDFLHHNANLVTILIRYWSLIDILHSTECVFHIVICVCIENFNFSMSFSIPPTISLYSTSLSAFVYISYHANKLVKQKEIKLLTKVFLKY